MSEEKITCCSLSFFLPHNSSITVTLGAHNVKKKEDTQQKIEVIEQYIHPKYNEFTVLNDIMLLKVTIFPLFFLFSVLLGLFCRSLLP